MAMKKIEKEQSVKNIEAPPPTNHETFLYWRRAERFLCSLCGSLIVSETLNYPIQCKNISVEGISIISPIHLHCRSHAVLKISTSAKESFTLEGSVCWCKKYRDSWYCGIKFDRVLPFELKKIFRPALRYSEYVSIV